MKRLVSFILIIVSLFSVALADDYSSMTYNELKTELDKILLEISKKNINSDKLLCDSDGFKVYITGNIEFDYGDYDKTKKVLVIPITAFNESNQALSLHIDTISFNGWEIDFPLCYFSLDANKKCKDTIIVEDFLEKTDIISLFQLKEIEAYYRIKDIDYNEVNKNCRTTVILAKQEEEIKPYNVFIGIQWGDSIETVRDMFGKGKENKLDIMTFITYENVKFGDLEPYNIRFGFANERLFSITVLFMLPKDDFYQNMVNAYTQELGQETQKEEYKYIWELPDGTRIEVETDKHNNSVDLSFTNSEWVEEESTEK